MGQPLSPDILKSEETLSAFFRYLDLCNYQVFLRMKERIGRETWNEWESGIRDNLSQPAFSEALNHLAASRGDCFNELKRLLSIPGKCDPASWKRE